MKKQIYIQVWSDNHGHDEMFGTKPNMPHHVYNDIADAEEPVNLLSIILDSLRNTLMRGCKNLSILVLARNHFYGVEEVRVRIANNEYVCRATIML